MEDTPIFDELRRQSGTPASTGQGSQLEADGTMAGPALDRNPPGEGSSPAKIIVAGGCGVGKTTFVGSVSEVAPLDTESWLAEAGERAETTTTVATDFGRITLHPDVLLYLFGTPEPQYWLGGALGAVVLVDPRRIQESFAVINYFENDSDVPFIVAVNMFDGQLAHELDEVREALVLAPDVPLTSCDARDPGSTAKALQELVSYIMNLAVSRAEPPPAAR